MTYLIIGEDIAVKENKILQLKQKFLTSPDSQNYDFDILYATKLDAAVLKKALIALPAVSDKRLIILHDCHKLSLQNKKIIIEFIGSPEDHVVLILESGQLTSRDSFYKKIYKTVELFETQSEQKPNVFNMTRAMSMRKKSEALKILHVLLSDGVHPLQIMGGLIWYWEKSRPKLSFDKFTKGLTCLQETDLNIKRSRLNPNYAMELLVVKLCSIL